MFIVIYVGVCLIIGLKALVNDAYDSGYSDGYHAAKSRRYDR